MSGYCTCKDGFSVNPATGRCRQGTACVAAGRDHWAVTVRIASPDCAMRPASACTSGTSVSGEIDRIALLDCHLPQLVTLRVELVAGCPTLFELDRDPGDPSLLSCLEKVLTSTRWSCAADTDCVLYEYDTI
jgi:hypothetical protein